ncbi:hypothetical protein [Streptomyces sp. NPDC097981]|uniref:hypothetical protein n=1 Tax=Streptomyces sp. NPDC097981 TaxID=3155428 RepID=UPI0033307FCB
MARPRAVPTVPRPCGDRPPPGGRARALPPTNRESVAGELAQARGGLGPTLFDILTEIFEEQASGALRLR